MWEEKEKRLAMSVFPELQQHTPKQLRRFFMGDGGPHVPEEEQELWLQEVAIQIAKTGAKGIDFLLSCVPDADELRLRAILLAMSLVEKKMSARKRANICGVARTLLNDQRAMIVAEAVDTLSHLGCPETAEYVSPLLQHHSPYVVGSALRFFARRDHEKAVPLLEEALKSEEPIVRQSAIDELDEMNYTPALPKIRQLLQDPDEEVRQAARGAVVHLENADSLLTGRYQKVSL
jgi:hypothetical protein